MATIGQIKEYVEGQEDFEVTLSVSNNSLRLMKLMRRSG